MLTSLQDSSALLFYHVRKDIPAGWGGSRGQGVITMARERYLGQRRPAPIIQAFNLQLPAGSVHALIGAAGAGKSTVLRLAAGFARPSSGYVECLGAPAREAPRDRIGYAPQQYQSYQLLTPAELLNGLAAVSRTPRGERDDRVEGAIMLCGLDAWRDVRVGRCPVAVSSRLGIAQTLLNAPELLLLDDPLLNLGDQEIEEMLDILAVLGETGTTMLIASRDARLAEICTGATLLRHGRIVDQHEALHAPPSAMEDDFTDTPLAPVAAAPEADGWLVRVSRMPSGLPDVLELLYGPVSVDGLILRFPPNMARREREVIDFLEDSGATVLHSSLAEAMAHA